MEKKEFKPYIPAEKITPEFTVASVVVGLILAVVFGAANAYLGLRVGMTISASIPAAVMSMGIMHIILRRSSVLESNMVQTIASAGEAVAAGAIFTLPVFFMWAQEGIAELPSVVTFISMGLAGSILGVLFMIPLRNALIVKEHGILPYPEGTACAQVILAGEKGGSSAGIVFIGMGIAALLKFVIEGLKIIKGTITVPLSALKSQFSMQTSPALFSVGYICGFRVSSIIFSGSLLAWFVIVPLMVQFGGESVIGPSTVSINEMYATGGAELIWKSYVKYIGAGALAGGGIISLVKSFPMIISAFSGAIKGIGGSTSSNVLRTEKDMSMKVVIIITLGIALALCFVPMVSVGPLGTLLVVVIGFFFSTVSSRMVGIIGTSNNPVSGMIIAALLVSAVIFKFTTANDIASGMVSTISVAAIVSFIVAIAGDTSQDLKTGYILGATPKYQQIGMIIASVVSAFTIGGMLMLLNSAWGFNTSELPAPQASLMKMITEGIMYGNLPWDFVFVGVFIAIIACILNLPVLPFAMGIFLPQSTVIPIMIGGVLSWIVKKIRAKKGLKESDSDDGILFGSGLIAGEGIMGVVLALLAILNVSGAIDLSKFFDTGYVGNIVMAALLCFLIVYYAVRKKKEKAES